MNIYLADDEKDYIESLGRSFNMFGYTAHVFLNGKTALEAMVNANGNGSKPDLLITDLNMVTTNDGLDLINKARAIDPSLPIILTTGNECPKGCPSNRFKYFTKPVSTEDLLKAAKEMLQV